MKTTKLSAVLTAAVLAGALAVPALAADETNLNLASGDNSIRFTKAISVDNARGSGGVQGTIEFDVTPALEADLPTGRTEDEQVGTATQIESALVSAVFTAADGIAPKEQDVTVTFNMGEFSKPGIYYYRLTERNARIKGLATADAYILKVRVVNASSTSPDGKQFKLDYAVLVDSTTKNKAEMITNEYTTHTLTLTKRLAGDFADYSDQFVFTLSFTDPDTTAHMTSVTVNKGKAGQSLEGTGTVLAFENGTASTDVTISGNEMIEVSGLPEGVTYTITEKGTDALKYQQTTWLVDGETTTGSKLEDQKMGAADESITVTNTRSSIAPTGLLLDAAPYGAMLALAAGSGAVVFRKRRRD